MYTQSYIEVVGDKRHIPFFQGLLSGVRSEEKWDAIFNQNRPVAPSVDIKEEEDEYVIMADIPGVSIDDVSVIYDRDSDVLNLEVTREINDKDKFWQHRRFSGTWKAQYSFNSMEINISRITATYENGVLEIHLPKHQKAATTPLKIDVTAKSK